MPRASFRFYGSLNDFLPIERRQVEFFHCVKDRGSIKDTIEALGVPHPEVDLILVNGQSVSFAYLVEMGDRFSLYPQFTALDIASLSCVHPAPLSPIRFVLDVHLGKLATYLRLLGFDTLYRNDYNDDDLAAIANQNERFLLTQDRGLLKRSAVTYGYAVRSTNPEEQMIEVLERFELYNALAPFQRCPQCNGNVARVDKEAVAEQIPLYTRLYYNDFSQCQNCQRVYWKGAHAKRIQGLIDLATAHAAHKATAETA